MACTHYAFHCLGTSAQLAARTHVDTSPLLISHFAILHGTIVLRLGRCVRR